MVWRKFQFASLTDAVFRDNCFEVVQFDSQLPPSTLHQTLGRGIEDPVVLKSRREVFGKCSVDVPSASFWKMWLDELTEPFYVFQLASIALWIWDEYGEYAYTVLAMALLSSCYDLQSARYGLLERSNPVVIDRQSEGFENWEKMRDMSMYFVMEIISIFVSITQRYVSSVESQFRLSVEVYPFLFLIVSYSIRRRFLLRRICLALPSLEDPS